MLDLIRRALSGRRARWDGVCRRCGLCCYQKEIRGRGVVTNWRMPCRFLDESTRLCAVYERRFQACGECRRMTIFHALFTPWLPETCGYVRTYRQRYVPLFPAGGSGKNARSDNAARSGNIARSERGG